jgi:hypothetical protein
MVHREIEPQSRPVSPRLNGLKEELQAHESRRETDENSDATAR